MLSRDSGGLISIFINKNSRTSSVYHDQGRDKKKPLLCGEHGAVKDLVDLFLGKTGVLSVERVYILSVDIYISISQFTIY